MRMKVLIIILLMAINIMLFNINIVQAQDLEGVSDAFRSGDTFLKAGNGNKGVSIDEKKLQDTSKLIYNILLTLGICIAVVIASILGMKFMIGSVEEKAQVKDALIPFVIGCVVISGAFGFWSIFIKIGNNVSSESETLEGEKYINSSIEKGKLYCSNSNCYSIVYKSDISDMADSRWFCCHSCHKGTELVCETCGKFLTYEEILKKTCNGKNGSGPHEISGKIMSHFIVGK